MSVALRPPPRGVQAVLAGAVVGVALIVYGGHRLVGPPRPAPALPPTPLLIPAAAPAPPPVPHLALKVPEGLRAFAIQASEEIAVANLVQPGDRVDVQTVLSPATLASLGTKASGEAGTLMQNVLVLAVDDRLEPRTGPKGDAPPPRTLTLALTPEQASALSLARSLGTFYLALRNPKDQLQAQPAPAHLSDIRHAPAPAPHRRAKAPAKPQPQGVELVVGGVSSFIKPEAGAAQ